GLRGLAAMERIWVAEESDQRQIELYLLGALPESETERLDELSLTDDGFAEQLRGAENDLVDAYARGELSEDMAQGFRARYLASPRRRAKLRFAQAFASGAESSGAKVALATTPDRDGIASTAQPWWARWFGSGWPAWAFAVAAVVALIATVYL